MKLSLTGRYHQIAKFFHGVGQLDRVINMENISLVDPKPDGEDIVVKVEALATAFRAKPDGQGGVSTDKRGGAKTGGP
jgi:type IV pilus assembly protein PilO